MSKPVVLIAEELSPATVEALGPDFEIRHCNGADRDELLAAIADVDAILVRSDFHGQGLGYALMLEMLGYARTRGLNAVFGEVLSENRRMLDMARELGAVVDGRSGPDRTVRVNFHLKP